MWSSVIAFLLKPKQNLVNLWFQRYWQLFNATENNEMQNKKSLAEIGLFHLTGFQQALP